MTHLRKMMLEELERRNYAQTTIDCDIQAIEDFARHFRRPPNSSLLSTSASTKRICSARESWLQPP